MHLTCAKCGHGFCWLCLGGKESHGGTDGHIYQCNSVADVLRKGFKVHEKDISTDTNSEYEMYRTDFYLTRYREHKKSVVFAEKRMA